MEAPTAGLLLGSAREVAAFPDPARQVAPVADEKRRAALQGAPPLKADVEAAAVHQPRAPAVLGEGVERILLLDAGALQVPEV